nr:InlB B-repeat-containing protein [uncultured Peptoniphilus sp.]
MRKRFLLYAILFIILTLPIEGYAQSNEKIDALIQKGWVVGRDNGDYALEDTVTRAEFTRMVVLLENKNFKVRRVESFFLDVKKDAWFAPYIEEAARKQWIVGDGDGRFRPNDHITYAEVFAILTRLRDSEIAKGKPWYANYVANAEKWGYTRGIKIRDYRDKALRRHVFDGIYNVLESHEKTEKSHENKTYPTLTFEFKKTEKTSKKLEIPKANEKKIYKIKLIDGDKIREINAPHGKTIAKPDVENREGYIFVGWFNGEEAFDFETPITSDLSLTAKFKPKNYTVKFADGETVNESKVTHGNTVTKPEDPVKEGYQFIGWYDGEKAFSFDRPITADVNLVAKFKPKMYTVKFTDGDEVIESKVTHGHPVTKPEDPVKEGYTFIGWFNGEESFDFVTPITSDINLVAKFKPKMYTVKFTSGEKVSKSTVAHGKIVDKPDDPVKEGCQFIGWYDGEKAFSFDKPITADVNLVAKFEPRTYTVKFTNGEKVNESKVTHGNTVTKPEDPVKEGYTFIGWFNGENAFSFDEPITFDISLMAKFVPEKVTVQIVDEEGNVLIEPETISYGSDYTLPTIRKTGYNLNFYSDNIAYSEKTKVKIFKDTTFIARFTKLIKLNIWSDKDIVILPSDREEELYVYGNFIPEGTPIPMTWIPKMLRHDDRYPLRLYDPITGWISPESYDLEKPVTDRTCLISITRAKSHQAIFLDIKPDESFDLKNIDSPLSKFYRRMEAKRIEDIPKSNAKVDGYHTDGWREIDKTERFEFGTNMVSAQGKVFVPYWVKDE